jgi:putative Ca2+/H+ antiporter (TMEM165/GDT1 family)
VGAGILFIFFAVWMWTRREEKEKAPHLQSKDSFSKTAWTSFIVIFIAEWGDLTQLATATLVAKTKDPVTIFLAATAALWATTALAVVIGHHAKKIIHPRVLQNIAAMAFAIVGILLLTGFWDK